MQNIKFWTILKEKKDRNETSVLTAKPDLFGNEVGTTPYPQRKKPDQSDQAL
jgi:hypothetical protein